MAFDRTRNHVFRLQVSCGCPRTLTGATRGTKMFDVVRRLGKHVRLYCWGIIEEIIPDLAEVGIEVLDPKSSCMERGSTPDERSGERFSG